MNCFHLEEELTLKNIDIHILLLLHILLTLEGQPGYTELI